MSGEAKPSVLFVCVKNGGKSQMAAALMNSLADGTIEVRSAGTHPGDKINSLSAQSLAELGIDISGEIPKPITDDAVRSVDVVVTLGREATVNEVEGTHFENWDIDEPSLRGIEGMERMRLVRDDIKQHVRQLMEQLSGR